MIGSATVHAPSIGIGGQGDHSATGSFVRPTENDFDVVDAIEVLRWEPVLSMAPPRFVPDPDWDSPCRYTDRLGCISALSYLLDRISPQTCSLSKVVTAQVAQLNFWWSEKTIRRILKLAGDFRAPRIFVCSSVSGRRFAESA